MKTIYDPLVFDVVVEFTKSEFEFPRAPGKPIQTTELTGRKDKADDFPVEIHRGRVRGCLTKLGVQPTYYITTQ